MALTEKELLTGVLRETLNLDDAGVASLYNEDGITLKDDAQTTILNMDAERVKSLKTGTNKVSFDDGYKKAQSETLTKLETDLKAKTGFKSDKKGIELILDYANSQKVAGELTDDVIKKHPVFLTAMEQKDAEILAAQEEGTNKLNGFQKEISKKETFSKVAQKGLEVFRSLNPVLSKDDKKKTAQENLLVKALQKFDWEIQGDRYVPLEDGKVKENGQGNPMQFDKLVQSIADIELGFEFHTIDPKQSAANKTTPATAKTFNFEVPKNATEFARVISDKSIPLDERNAIKDAYEKANPTS